jgi:carbonic anhydrase
MITTLICATAMLVSDEPTTPKPIPPARVKKLNATAQNAFKRLVEGNARFAEGLKNNPNQDIDTRIAVAKGQVPHTIVLTCADSRLSPELLFDQGLGDLFVVRVAGNVIDQYSVASVEYAAEHLHSTLFVVLGHERCGAVKAAVDAYHAHTEKSDSHGEQAHHEGPNEHANIGALLHEIYPSVVDAARAKGDLLANSIDLNVERTIRKSFEKSPLLLRLAQEGKLDVVGGTYDLDSGRVNFTAPKDLSAFVVVRQ